MRRTSLCFHLCMLALTCLGTKADILNCIRNIEGGFFDLTPLESNKDLNITIPGTDVILDYNICRFATRQCRSKFVFASLYKETSEVDCIQLTNTTKYYGIEYNAINPSRVADGVQLLFTGGDLISTTIQGWSPVSEEVRTKNSGAIYQFALNFYCNSEIETYNVTNMNFDVNTFTYSIDIETTHGCPMVTLDQVFEFVDDNKIIFTVIGAVIGLGVAFLGLKLFLPTIFLAGFISGFMIALFTFFAQVITPESRESTKWILFGFAILLGSALGYITVKANKFGIFLIGAWLGTIISLLLYNAILYKIHTDPAELVLLITLGVLGIGGGLLSLKFYKHVIIISTSLVGSYAFVRALSLVIGGFPNEIEIIQQIQLQDYNFSVDWPFYVYMNVIFLLTLFSVWVQLKIKKRSDANEIDFDNDYFKKIDV